MASGVSSDAKTPEAVYYRVVGQDGDWFVRLFDQFRRKVGYMSTIGKLTSNLEFFMTARGAQIAAQAHGYNQVFE